jgi:hypothetical protein
MDLWQASMRLGKQHLRVFRRYTMGQAGEILDGKDDTGLQGNSHSAMFSPLFHRKNVELIDSLTEWLAQVAPTAKITFLKQVFGVGEGLARSGSKSTKVQLVPGLYDGGLGLITAALNYSDLTQTVRHEAIHHLKAAGLFTRQEWAVLARAAEKHWNALYQVTDNEEGVAYAFGDWRRGKSVPEVNDGIIQSFRKIGGFLARTGNWLRGNGFQNAEDVFERVESGELGQRIPAASDLEGGVRYRADPQAPEWHAFAERANLRRLLVDTDQWMKAPNGQPTQLTESQWLTVRTAGFKRWFGDWEESALSKMTDEDFFQESSALEAASLIEGVIASHLADSEPVCLQRRFGTGSVFLTESAHHSGYWQITYLDQDLMPTGDSQYHNKESALREFFLIGDWENKASALLNENGEPLPVFRGEHGPDASNPFDSTRLPTPTFTNQPDIAGVYAMAPNNQHDSGEAARLLACFLRMDQPLVISESGDPFTEMHHLFPLRDALGVERFEALAQHLHRTYGLRYDGEAIEQPAEIVPYLANFSSFYVDSYRVADDPMVTQMAQEAGFDGLSYWGATKTEPALEFRPFTPTQIKSAIGNIGTFDPANADIRYQVADQAGRSLPKEGGRTLKDYLPGVLKVNPLVFLRLAVAKGDLTAAIARVDQTSKMSGGLSPELHQEHGQLLALRDHPLFAPSLHANEDAEPHHRMQFRA